MTVDQLKPNQVQRGLAFPEPVDVRAKQNLSSELSIHGVQKTDETGRLCRTISLKQWMEFPQRNSNIALSRPHLEVEMQVSLWL